jgi:hypothetical protein
MTLQKTLTAPTPEQDALIRLLASRYVRRENRFYHIDRPNEALNRNDVERAFIHTIARELPELPHDPATLKLVFRTAIDLVHSDPRRTIPIWGGQQASVPGNEARLIWNEHGTVMINTWRRPAYRTRGVNAADYGRFQPLFEALFQDAQERDRVLDWVAWTLQNEDDRPNGALLLYSRAKGTGKSTFCDVLRHLHGQENSTTQNNVDKIVSRFNRPALQSRLVICEELSLRSESTQSNTLKTYITEATTMAEAKGREAEVVELISCFVFTTNHLPTWLEPGERRYFVVQTDHDGHASGPRAAEFSGVVAGVYEALDDPDEVAALYNALVHRELNENFNPKSLNTERDGTAIMKQLLGTSGETMLDQLAEFLEGEGLDVIPQATVQNHVSTELHQNGNRTRHMMQELGWTQHKVKWGGVDYARVVWVKPGHHVADGNLIRPDGTTEAIGDHILREAGL